MVELVELVEPKSSVKPDSVVFERTTANDTMDYYPVVVGSGELGVVRLIRTTEVAITLDEYVTETGVR